MRIKDDKRKEYLSKLSAETGLKVTVEGDEGTYAILFCGIVTDFAMVQDGYATILRVEAKSGAILMNEKEHFRVFQNKDSACNLLFNRITAAYSGGKVNFVEGERQNGKGCLCSTTRRTWNF